MQIAYYTYRAYQTPFYKNRQINDNLEQQAQALFKSWFVDFEPFKGGKFVDSELGIIPEGWRVGTINDMGISMISGDWGKEEQQGNYNTLVSCIRGVDIPNIQGGSFHGLPNRYILNKNFVKKELFSDTLVVEISGGSPTQSTGRICYISDEFLSHNANRLICTNFCRAIKPIPIYSWYIYYLWTYLYNKGRMFSYENGTTGIKNFDISSFLMQELVLIPKQAVISKFNTLVKNFNNVVCKNGIEAERLAQTRDTILPKLMSGELSINL